MENTAVVQPTLTRGESGTLLSQTMALVAATAGVFAWSTLWVYIVVQAVAGIAAGLTFLALNPADK